MLPLRRAGRGAAAGRCRGRSIPGTRRLAVRRGRCPMHRKPSPADGRRIGPYRLVRELARGGMGVVYLAERADGQFEQRVALKLIKRGMDSDEIHRRFLRRAADPGPAHPPAHRPPARRRRHRRRPAVLRDGVRGRARRSPPTARRGGSGSSERLRLFLDVCEAVRYAHQNLVVHRDLKPAEHPGDRRRRGEAARLRHRQAAEPADADGGDRRARPRPSSGC